MPSIFTIFRHFLPVRVVETDHSYCQNESLYSNKDHPSLADQDSCIADESQVVPMSVTSSDEANAVPVNSVARQDGGTFECCNSCISDESQVAPIFISTSDEANEVSVEFIATGYNGVSELSQQVPVYEFDTTESGHVLEPMSKQLQTVPVCDQSSRQIKRDATKRSLSNAELKRKIKLLQQQVSRNKKRIKNLSNMVRQLKKDNSQWIHPTIIAPSWHQY